MYFEDGAEFDSPRDRSVYINGYQWSSMVMVINGNGHQWLSMVISMVFLMKILHITKKQTISLTVGLILHDRNPFYAKRKPFRSNNVRRVSCVYMTKYLFFLPSLVDNL